MQTYNRALDYTVLALNELKNGKPVLAARLLASAAQQSDLDSAIATLEASNKYAFSLKAKRLVAVADEFPFADEVDGSSDDEFEQGEEEHELESEFGEDPLNEVGEDEGAPASAMARVLTSMVRRRK